ncbi:MAG: putative addiction module antidote protein [Elusimicrobia bacterium]|nr:putative addiction module antidote protein [Elusimicrobiota bacterium]
MSSYIPYTDYLYERLKDPEDALGYLNACLETGDDGDFLLAVRDVANVYGGLRPLAGRAGLNREHLFRMLSRKGNPELHSLRQIMAALGFQLKVEPIPSKRAAA